MQSSLTEFSANEYLMLLPSIQWNKFGKYVIARRAVPSPSTKRTDSEVTALLDATWVALKPTNLGS